MGAHNNITASTFPKQGVYKGARCEVRFHYDTSETVLGTIVRDDAEEPYALIIQLDDGRFVNSTECRFLPKRESKMFTKADGDSKGMKLGEVECVLSSSHGKSNFSPKGQDDSILQKLQENEIFSVETREEMIVVSNEREWEYSTTLTPIEVRKLAQELLEIANEVDGEVFEKIDSDCKGMKRGEFLNKKHRFSTRDHE